MAFNADDVASAPPPELITFDEQVVEYEVEIDTFDGHGHHYEGEEEEGLVVVDEHQNSIQLPNEIGDYVVEEEEEGIIHQDHPGTSGYHYQYADDVEGEVNPIDGYLFGEDPSQCHLPYHSTIEDEQIDVQQYVDLSDSQMMTSSSNIPGPASFSSSISRLPSNSEDLTPFQIHQRGIHHHHNNLRPPPGSTNYLIGKTTGNGERKILGFNPIRFQTHYTLSEMPRSGKRVIKRTHTPILSHEQMESMMEDSQVMKRIEKELSILKRENDDMKKTLETVNRDFETRNMLWIEAKTKQKAMMEEKRRLQRELINTKTSNNQLTKQSFEDQPRTTYGYHHHHHNHHN